MINNTAMGILWQAYCICVPTYVGSKVEFQSLENIYLKS